MRIQVKFFALARDLAGTAQATMDLPEGATVGQAWDEIIANHPGLARYREEFLVAVNRRFAEADRRLAEGDEVAIIPPVSGGQTPEPQVAGPGGRGPQVAGPEVGGSGVHGPGHAGSSPGGSQGEYEITSAPLDLTGAVQAVRHPEAGAVVVFVGTVRERTGETRTLEIDYEAYPEMAREQLAAIGEEVRRRWDVRGIHVTHRQGRLKPGEDSVVIAVSAPHRGDAFAACRYVIDRIKETVPVWKKETTGNGTRWVSREG